MKDALKKGKMWISVLILTLLPLLACILRTALDGTTLWNIKLAATIGNDEVFYYKYVEAILEYGHPMGFFGFNESRALIGGGPAWSPVISMYWMLFGKLFGWNYMSPIIANIFVMSGAWFLFGIIVKPTLKQTAILAILYLCYGQITYYTLSGVPECIVYSLFIICMASVIGLYRKYSTRLVTTLWILTFLLTLMRPYYVVLFLLVAYFIWGNSKKRAIICGTVGLVTSAAVYALINKFLCAQYFGKSVIGMGIDPADFEGSPWQIFKNLVKILLYGINKSLYWMKEAIVAGNFQGRMLIVLFAVFLLFIGLLWHYRKQRQISIFILYFVGYFIVRYVAVIFLYNKNVPPEAIRHAYDFILVGIIAIALCYTKSKGYHSLVIGMAGILIVTQFVLPMNYPEAEGNSLDYATKTEMRQIEDTQYNLEQTMQVTGTDISYKNDIIWVFADMVGEERKIMEWKSLYGIPAGMALNICYADYVKERFAELESQYIATVPNGDIAKICKENGAQSIYSNDVMIIYQLRRGASE